VDKFQHKKRFGQHFLDDETIASQITEALLQKNTCKQVLEIGPGIGVLTKYLVADKNIELFISEIDRDIIPLIQEKFSIDDTHMIAGDFLQLDFTAHFPGELSLIGNFPYNISTQIIFKMLDNKERIPLMVGMFQKEVAERIAAHHGSKIYGITSVLAQAFYDVEYLVTVPENVFTPPPKVKSAVIRLTRKTDTDLGCNAALFREVVKAGFNQRRKTLRNALKSLHLPPGWEDVTFSKRAEQLSVQDFVELTRRIESTRV
jgi:16S rRNA (adenine1518-N6/adenine1519-N6)-dimethyltransferase